MFIFMLAVLVNRRLFSVLNNGNNKLIEYFSKDRSIINIQCC